MDIAGQSALEGSDSNCHYCDAQDQVKNCEKPKPDGLLGTVNLPATLCRSFASKQPSHDQHKESHPSKDKNVWLDCAPERVPNVEHGTTLADRSRCHASCYALSQFSKNGFRETTGKFPKPDFEGIRMHPMGSLRVQHGDDWIAAKATIVATKKR